ncbi:MAG: hypothetical protein OXJ52_03120 [Oligoflexia bacterium]|nr:hypothetical protein [Oligoflexia bacterium]
MKFINIKTISDKLEELLSSFFSLKGFFLAFLILLSIFINFVFVTQPLKIKSRVSQIYKKNLRQTLSRVEGPLTEIGMDIRVLKVKQEDKIYLEFLSKKANNSYWFINSVELKGSREAYFDYHGDPSSLLLVDADKDGLLDVVAPTFDKFFWPHRNLVAYNKETKKFGLKKQDSYPRVIAPEQRENFFSCGFWCLGD